MKKLTVLFALLALAPFAFAACGGDDDEDTGAEETTEETTTEADSGGGGGGTVAIAAAEDGSLAYDTTELTASAGANTFEFDNPASLAHDFCIEQDGSEVACTDQITESSTSVDADLESGEYVFYCSVSGHREGGMEGTLTVE
jgi:plastocyanin